MSWFNEKDSEKTIKNHISDKKCPDSIKKDAERELRRRGYTRDQIFEIEKNDHITY